MRTHSPLPSPDSHHLSSAIGWLELGNHIEANEELEQISACRRAHPDVLKIRAMIYERAKKEDVCLEIADALTRMLPTDSDGWVRMSLVFYRMGKTQEAMDCLRAKHSEFAQDWRVPYHLGLYAAQLGLFTEAKNYLHEAMNLGDKNAIQRFVITSPAFQPLREHFNL